MNRKTLIIESDSLEEIEASWVNEYSNKWDVKTPINVKWSWSKFRFVYRLILIEKDNRSSIFSLLVDHKMSLLHKNMVEVHRGILNNKK